jgi:lipopolysaccharide transport system permease protein
MQEIKALTNKYFYYVPYYLAKISLYRGHRSSYLGWLWLAIKPSIQICIYGLIFPLIAKFQQKDYVLYLISGILPWGFISNSIIEAGSSLIARGEVLKRCLLSKVIFPIADTIKNLLLTIISLFVMLVIYNLFFGTFHYYILLLPIAMIPMMIFTFASGVAISFITPYVRDISDITAIMFNIMFFFTPIFYPVESLPEHVQKLFKFNPFFWLIRPIQDVLYFQTIPQLSTCIISMLVACGSALIALAIYKKLKKNVIFYL